MEEQIILKENHWDNTGKEIGEQERKNEEEAKIRKRKSKKRKKLGRVECGRRGKE